MVARVNDGEAAKADRPPVLPVVPLEGKAYFIDLSGRQFRETMNPRNYVDFDSVLGERLCKLAGVVTCRSCGASVIVAGEIMGRRLRCVRCGAVVNG